MVQQQDRGSYSLGPVGVHSHSPGPISCLQMLTGEVTGDVQGPTPPFLRPLMVASLQVRYWLSWTALAGGGSFRGLRQPPHSYPPGQELHGLRKVHQLLSALITHGEPNEPVHGEPNFLRDSVHYLDPQASVGRWPQ